MAGDLLFLKFGLIHLFSMLFEIFHVESLVVLRRRGECKHATCPKSRHHRDSENRNHEQLHWSQRFFLFNFYLFVRSKVRYFYFGNLKAFRMSKIFIESAKNLETLTTTPITILAAKMQKQSAENQHTVCQSQFQVIVLEQAFYFLRINIYI